MFDETTGEKRVYIKRRVHNSMFSPVISSNIYRYFNIFHEFKVLKKVITAETLTFIINASNFVLFVFSIFLHTVAFISLFTSIYIYIYIYIYTHLVKKKKAERFY